MSSGSRSPTETQGKAPRLYHTKSRNGCQRCRARRVKCNETRPTCANCHRHGVSCVYNTTPQTSAKSTSPKESFPPPGAREVDLLADYRPTRLPPPIDDVALQQLLSGTESENESMFEMSESKERRMLELRLQQNFIERTSQTLSGCHNPKVRSAWAVEVPKLGLMNENVLYGMLALSTLHLLKSEPDNGELMYAREAYVGLALREHRRAIALLNSGNADAVCYASTLALTDAFACLQERPLDPYAPPMQWVHMARGSGSVFGVAFDRINNVQTAKIMPLVEAASDLTIAAVLFADENRHRLEHILDQGVHNDDMQDEEARQAYEKAVSYIGSVQRAIEAGEHRLAICRRAMGFALLCPKRFFTFVEEQHPRALVVLAHFFALLSSMEDIWWIGKVARREIEGIQRSIPVEWQGLMRIPLASVGLPTSQ